MRLYRRAILAVVSVALIVPVIEGCATLGPSIPPAGGESVAPPLSSPSAQPTPTVSTVPVSQRSLQATLGIQMYWNDWGPVAQTQADLNRIYNYIVGLGANTVGINFFFFTNGVYPTTVYGTAGMTPSPATIGMAIAEARKHGLRVLVRPLLNENNIIDARGDWRGSIQPPSLSEWFASYYDFLKPYFSVAQANGATSFDIGTELDSLAPYESDWSSFEAAAQQIFHGELQYAVNYGRWAEDPSYEPVPYAGVDAYPGFFLPADATVGALTDAWAGWLLHQPENVLAHTVLQEVGIAAAAGAYSAPYRPAAAGTPLDIGVQQNWFAAACAAAKLEHLTGIYFYDVNSGDDPANAAGYAPGSFIGRGDSVIRGCFSSGWS